MDRFLNFELHQHIALRRIIQGLIILGIFVMAITPINHENDIFWQLRMGEEIVKNHYFPTHDIFSLPAYGEIWTLHEWLPSLTFYLIYQSLGPAALIFFKAIIISLTFALFLLLFNKIKANLYLSLLVLGVAVIVNTRGIWVVFPSIFEYLFLVLALFLLESYREKPRKTIAFFLCLLSFVWVNSHGSFFLLPGIVGAYLVGDILIRKLTKTWAWYKPDGPSFSNKERWWLFIVVIVSLSAPMMTPNGFLTYLYPFRITFGKFTPYVSEYRSFWALWKWNWSDYILSFTLILMIGLWLTFLINLKRLHARDLILGVSFTILALFTIRHIAIFALVALFLIVRYTTFWFGEYRGIFRRSLKKDLVVIALVVCVVFYYKTKIVSFGFKMTEDGYPKAAAELINASGLEGNMFNHYNYGGYLIWKMPDYKVFIDGRLEMYQGKAGEDYITILSGSSGYKDLLEKYKINFFIMNAGEKIVELLVNDSEWKYVYNDRQYVVFVKNSPKNSDFLSKNWSSQKQEAFQEDFQASLRRAMAEDYHREGVEALRSGNTTAALSNFEAVVKYDPLSVSAHLNLAQVEMDLDMFDEAQKEYEFILSNLDASNTAAKEGLEKMSQYLKLLK